MRFADTTAHLEPDSVILRDPKSGVKLSILEQNYRADPIASGLLLSLNEGKVIEVDGQLQFSLPGEPRLPALSDDTILKPTLDWRTRGDTPDACCRVTRAP